MVVAVVARQGFFVLGRSLFSAAVVVAVVVLRLAAFPDLLATHQSLG